MINADFRELCIASLTGQGAFPMDGRPVLDEYAMVREPDGSLAMLIEPTVANRAIMRWAEAEFTARERRSAAGHRQIAASFSVDALSGRLRQYHVLIPRPRDIPDIAVVVDAMLQQRALQAAFLDWLMEQLQFPRTARDLVVRRWEVEGRPLMADFAVYAHHCTRTLLMLLVGMRHKKLSSRPTNRVDIEYLFYAPFCEVFVSGDTLHVQLAPMVLRPDQTFRRAADFKTELACQWRERQERRAGA